MASKSDLTFKTILWWQAENFRFIIIVAIVSSAISCAFYVFRWSALENNMEKASHNQISCLKCFEGVCVNRAQCVRRRNDFLLQAQRFADERQEGRSRNHVMQAR